MADRNQIELCNFIIGEPDMSTLKIHVDYCTRLISLTVVYF